MRKINSGQIEAQVIALIRTATFTLRDDVFSALVSAGKRERLPRARHTIGIIKENVRIARIKELPICQDTGVAIVYLEIGQEVYISGDPVAAAVQRAIAKASKQFYLRKSIVKSPLERHNTGTNAPGIVHYRIVPGKKITVKVMLKGFGCENKGKVYLFNPTASRSEIEEFICTTVQEAGANACPPFVVGVGIGGTLDAAASLSKEVVFRKLSSKNRNKRLAAMERRIEKCVNRSGVGPLGFGGKTTILRVFIDEYPTHIAGLPVAVNINCHALRTAIATI